MFSLLLRRNRFASGVLKFTLCRFSSYVLFRSATTICEYVFFDISASNFLVDGSPYIYTCFRKYDFRMDFIRSILAPSVGPNKSIIHSLSLSESFSNSLKKTFQKGFRESVSDLGTLKRFRRTSSGSRNLIPNCRICLIAIIRGGRRVDI